MKTSRPAIDLTCIDCGNRNDATTGTGQGEIPGDGDVCMCIYCGALAFFDFPASKLREPTQAELVELHMDQNIRRAMFAWKHSLKSR